ncbi:MAG: transporter substrate-binding domain-containing protein [Leptolyngbyaceae cyanobacterium MO_188.B28]|nr:transporter substrate-binding domain-containing protein [Leptolyngbyaceae cyanobacterium MO_188.B28]
MSFTTVESGRLSIIASDFDARPISYLEGTDRLGYEPEVMRAICDRLGLEPIWYDLPLSTFYTNLSNGKYDVVCFHQVITQERRAWADFTRPYGLFDKAVLVQKESPVQSPKDLKGLKLGGLVGSTNLETAADFPDPEIIEFNSNQPILPEMLVALRQGKIDALVDDELLLKAVAASDPTLRIAFPIPTQLPSGIGVIPGNRELLQALNDTLNQLLKEGTLVKLWLQWIPDKPFPFP